VRAINLQPLIIVSYKLRSIGAYLKLGFGIHISYSSVSTVSNIFYSSASPVSAWVRNIANYSTALH